MKPMTISIPGASFQEISVPDFSDKLRFTIGTDDEMQIAID